MEVYNKQGRQLFQNDGIEFTHKNKTTFSLKSTAPGLRKLKSFKSMTSFGGVSKSRLRRLNSIEQNLTDIFKQNQSKLSLYLKNQHSLSDMITPLNLENPDIFTILQDGVYVLIQGTVKMITFSQQRPITKNSMKQVVGNVFRKLRMTKQLGGVRSREQNSEHAKKCFVNEKLVDFYNVACFDEPFSVFETVNENCLTFSNDTIIYHLDDQEKRVFRYYQNKDQVSRLLRQNICLFKNHSMLYHTFMLKRFSFRNQIKVENIALVKKGTLKVYTVDSSQNTRKQNTNFLSSTCSSRKLICQLNESSLLVKGFTYQISSHQADILFIEKNNTFQLMKNPDWARHFNQSQEERKKSKILPRQLKKKSLHATLRQKLKRQTLKKVSNSNYTQPLQQIQADINVSPTKSLSRDRTFGISHRKTTYLPNHKKMKSQVLNTQKYNDNSLVNNSISQKNKKSQFFKLMSPYVIISQIIGLKQTMKTRTVVNEKILLNERSLNISPLKFGGKFQQINKMSKSRIQNIKNAQFLSKTQQQNSLNHTTKKQRCTLGRFQRFLQHKNHQQYKKQGSLNKKARSMHHRKSFSQLTPINSSTFQLALKKIFKSKINQGMQIRSTNQGISNSDNLYVERLKFL